MREVIWRAMWSDVTFSGKDDVALDVGDCRAVISADQAEALGKALVQWATDRRVAAREKARDEQGISRL